MTCSVPGCERRVYGYGICQMHYQQERKKHTPLCKSPGCKNRSHAKGYCSTHYGRMWTNGTLVYVRHFTRQELERTRDRIKALEIDLKEELRLYDLACSFEARMRIHRRIRSLQETLADMKQKKTELPKAAVREVQPAPSGARPQQSTLCCSTEVHTPAAFGSVA